MKKKKETSSQRVVIAGAGQVGIHIMQEMAAYGHDIILIDENEDRINEARERADVGTFVGNACNPQLLMDIGLNENDLFISVTNSDETNLVACHLAKAFGCQTKIARVRKPYYRSYSGTSLDDSFWENMGVEVLFNQWDLTVSEIQRLLQNPGAYDMISLPGHDMELVGYRIQESSVLAGRRLIGLRDVPLFRDLIVAAINRITEGEVPTATTIIPRGDYRMQVGDVVYLAGKKANLNKVASIFDPGLSTRIKHIFIMGGSILAHELAEILAREYSNKTIYLIEKNRKFAYDAAAQLPSRVHVLLTDIHKMDDLLNEGLDANCVFIAASDDEDQNVIASILVHEESQANTITILQDTANMQLLHRLNIGTAVSPKHLLIDDVLRVVRTGAFDVFAAKGLQAEILDFIVDKESIIEGKALKDFRFPEGAIVVSVLRNDKASIPDGNTVFQSGDHVIIFALKTSVKEVEHIFR